MLHCSESDISCNVKIDGPGRCCTHPPRPNHNPNAIEGEIWIMANSQNTTPAPETGQTLNPHKQIARRDFLHVGSKAVAAGLAVSRVGLIGVAQASPSDIPVLYEMCRRTRAAFDKAERAFEDVCIEVSDLSPHMGPKKILSCLFDEVGGPFPTDEAVEEYADMMYSCEPSRSRYAAKIRADLQRFAGEGVAS